MTMQYDNDISSEENRIPIVGLKTYDIGPSTYHSNPWFQEGNSMDITIRALASAPPLTSPLQYIVMMARPVATIATESYEPMHTEVMSTITGHSRTCLRSMNMQASIEMQAIADMTSPLDNHEHIANVPNTTQWMSGTSLVLMSYADAINSTSTVDAINSPYMVPMMPLGFFI
jgi:hypothetical protein